jgi:hypothetical protein
MTIQNRKFFPILTTLLLTLLVCMNVHAEVTVDSAEPDNADQGTVGLPVIITGGGFEQGASVKFLVAGSKKGGGVSVNSVNYVSPSELIANIDVAVDAVVGDYDIEVQISRGRKGKGSTKFAVIYKSPGTDLGQAIPMDCILEGSWGDSETDTLKNDKLGIYSDDVDKTACGVGGPSLPWPLSLGLGSKGNPARSVRKIDLVFDETSFVDGTDEESNGRDFLPDYLFREAREDPNNPGWPDLDDMEPISLVVRPYRDTQTEDGIHLLPWKAEGYKMGLTFRLPGSVNLYRFSVASRHFPGNEKFTGIQCHTGNEQYILDNAPGGPMQDVTVYLWPDDDGDGLPDGYSVTTGAFINHGANLGTENEVLPETTDEPLVAAICGLAGPKDCADYGGGWCNFLGYVNIQLTLHARVQ